MSRTGYRSWLGALCALTLVLAPALAQAQPAGEAAAKPSVVVHLSRYTGDLHAVSMALGLARTLVAGGGSVTLFLDLEGVRLVDARGPADLSFGHGESVGAAYDAFVAAGGRVLVCSHCAAVAGIDVASLRKGARIATEDEVSKLFLGVDRVIDY